MNDFVKQKTMGLFVKTNGALSRLLLNQQGLIFCFHRVMELAEEGELFGASRLSNTITQLEQAIQFFKQKGFAFVSMDEVHANLGKSGSKKFVAFTFDDGYRDNYTNLLPFMEAAGVPFIVYVATNLIEKKFAHWWYEAEEIISCNEQLVLPIGSLNCQTKSEKLTAFNQVRSWLIESESQTALINKLQQLREQKNKPIPTFNRDAMSWEQVAAISNSKTGSIGAHTVNHLALARLSAGDVEWEMSESKRILEQQLGKTVDHFAYPYGTPFECYHREYEMAAQVGYKTAVTLRPGGLFKQAASKPMALPRVFISNQNTAERLREIENGIFHFRHNGFTKLIYA